MSSLIKQFEGHQIRMAGTPENPLFVAGDVCAVLGLANTSQALDSLDEDEKGICISDTPGGPQQMLAITESGLYALVFKSRKPTAKRFRRWVTGEVLPEIRKHGLYLPTEPAIALTARAISQEMLSTLDALIARGVPATNACAACSNMYRDAVSTPSQMVAALPNKEEAP